MHPAFSVLFLTTFIGAAQGFFISLFGLELMAQFDLAPMPDAAFFTGASAVVVMMAIVGLVASVFHLGRPERAWRSAAMWRTSWLSREVIVLPAFIAVSAVYGTAHALHWATTLAVGAVGTVLAIALFVCTGMIYACIRFLQEWSSPLTVINFTVLGMASGSTLAAAFSAFMDDRFVHGYAILAIVSTILGLCTRSMSLVRNARLRHKSSLQTATGIRHPRIAQKSQGFMGGSFNTREFFHGRTRWFLRNVRTLFLIGAFVVPILLVIAADISGTPALLLAAFVCQFLGLIAERWYFFAEANHPQNLYYQAIA